MHLLNGVVQAHKQNLNSLIHGSELFLTVRLMPPRTSAGVNILYGDPTRETSKAGETKGPFKCLWYDALAIISGPRGVEPIVQQLAGQFKEADSFAELWLGDVLVDTSDPFGNTWFDKAQAVVFNGKRFDYLGSAKLGLSTTAPYIIMVALKGAAGHVD